MLPCRAAEELVLLPVPVELLLPHPGTALAPEVHRACEPDLSILLSFTASSPKQLQPDRPSQPNLAKAGVKYEGCPNLGGIQCKDPQKIPARWHRDQPRGACCAWGRGAHPAHPKQQQGTSSSARKGKGLPGIEAIAKFEGGQGTLLKQQLVISTCQSSQNW